MHRFECSWGNRWGNQTFPSIRPGRVFQPAQPGEDVVPISRRSPVFQHMSQKKSNSQKQARALRARRLRRANQSQASSKQGECHDSHGLGSFARHLAATDGKVRIGWFAFYGTNCLCDMDALVIAGSQKAIRNRAQRSGAADWQFHSTTFGEIVQGMASGGVYAFDDEAYARFAPLAIRIGLPVPPPLPIEPPPGCDPEDHLVHIYPFSAM